MDNQRIKDQLCDSIHCCEGKCNECEYNLDLYGNKLLDEFAHELKETFNAECPINYESTKPFFTLDNVRAIVDMVAAEFKNSDAQ